MDVFAAVRLKSAHWSWLVETSTRICGFCYTDGSMQLFDCEGPTLLARLTDQELQHTLAAGATGRVRFRQLLDQHFVDIAPLPIFARLERLHDRMLAAVEVLGRVLMA